MMSPAIERERAAPTELARECVLRKRGAVKPLQSVSRLLLCLLLLCGFGAGILRPAGYAAQFREAASAAPSLRFPFGTDDLGRDLLARSLYGMRLSLILSGAAAAMATAIAAAAGLSAGYAGRGLERALELVTSLLMALPWIFLMLLARSVLPLDIGPPESAAVTFLLLALLGWAPASRLFAARGRSLRGSGFAVRARAEGATTLALIRRHLLPNVRALVWSQFLVLLPAFILSEATLGFLGLGVAEPLPSMGALLRELEDYSAVIDQPWRMAPLALMCLTVLCLQNLAPKDTPS